jgi:hypothetical protein
VIKDTHDVDLPKKIGSWRPSFRRIRIILLT